MQLNAMAAGRIRGILVWLGAGAIVLWGTSRAWGAQDEGEQNLPTGKEIVERYIEAAGGREAMAKVKNRVIKAELSMEQMGITGTTVITQARPNLYHAKAEISEVVTVENGSNGKTAWELNSITGPRLVEGEEKGMMLWMQRFDDTRYDEDMKSVECVGTVDVKGEECYKVVMTPKEARAFTMCFSKESGLPVKVELVFAHMFGDIQVESWLGDFRDVDGILYPHTAIEAVMRSEMKTTVTEIEHDVEIPKEFFELPAEIRTLLERAAAEKKVEEKGEPATESAE